MKEKERVSITVPDTCAPVELPIGITDNEPAPSISHGSQLYTPMQAAAVLILRRQIVASRAMQVFDTVPVQMVSLSVQLSKRLQNGFLRKNRDFLCLVDFADFQAWALYQFESCKICDSVFRPIRRPGPWHYAAA